MKPWKFVNLEQRSPKWHAWRNEGIGASEARYLINYCHGELAPHLIKIKVTPPKPFWGNKAMQQGRLLEPVALSAYEKRVGSSYTPVCIEHRKQSWLRASLDGLSACHTRAVEIKCGKAALAKAVAGEIPHDYLMQVHYVMAITGFEAVDYWCYLPDLEPVLMTIARDEAIIAKLIENAAIAWEQILAGREAQ
jgi:putative phage-type endonuclease